MNNVNVNNTGKVPSSVPYTYITPSLNMFGIGDTKWPRPQTLKK